MDLASYDFRHLDRGLAAAGIDFTGCYFRAADLRGVDFSKMGQG
ncbi:MAG: pentapeptide repeat-containing protein, partial [Candidatus Binatia bacterium]